MRFGEGLGDGTFRLTLRAALDLLLWLRYRETLTGIFSGHFSNHNVQFTCAKLLTIYITPKSSGSEDFFGTGFGGILIRRIAAPSGANLAFLLRMGLII